MHDRMIPAVIFGPLDDDALDDQGADQRAQEREVDEPYRMRPDQEVSAGPFEDPAEVSWLKKGHL